MSNQNTDTSGEAVGRAFVIELGHGEWDCSSIALAGRHGIAFHRRTHPARVGEVTAPHGSVLQMDGEACIIWFDGPELGATVRAIVADAERLAVEAGASAPGDIDVAAAERGARQRAEAEIDRLREEVRELRGLLVGLGAGIPAAAILRAEDRA